MKVTVVIASLLLTLCFQSFELVHAQAPAASTGQAQPPASSGGPLKRLHSKIRNMRPRIKMRKAIRSKIQAKHAGEAAKASACGAPGAAGTHGAPGQ